MSCAELDTFLEENKKLELGEEAGWTPEGLSKVDAAKSIYLPAIAMLKEMDGLGQNNHNGSDFRYRLPTAEDETLKTSKHKANYQFW